MIVKMQKVTLMCVSHDRAATLQALRELGVLHVRPVVPPTGLGLDQAREKVAGLKHLLEVIPVMEDAKPSGRDAWTVVAETSDLLDARKELQSQLDAMEAEAARIEPFGEFKPAMARELEAKGITLKLYRVPAKSDHPLPEGVTAEKLAQIKKDAYWALCSREPFEWEGAEEMRMPQEPLSAVQSEIQRIRDELTAGEKTLEVAAGDRPLLEGLLQEAVAEEKLQEVRGGMGASKTISYLQGFVPAADVDKIRSAAADHGWGLLVEEPGPQDDVPVKLNPPRWSTPIKAVFDGIDILPAYTESDVSVIFMLFFSLFFAMIIGDAGYGAVFVGLTLLMRKKLPKDAFRLLMITSTATIVWGLVNGTVFGISPEILDKAGFDKIQIPFLTDENRAAQNIMGLCFLIGAIQLSVAHLWNVWDLIREKKLKALEQFGWAMTTWFMFFLADSMVIGGNMESYLHLTEAQSASLWHGLYIMAGVGVALIVLFMMPPKKIKDEWFGLALLPLDLVGNFTDVVSYVRLYAVGTAGFAVANAFNTMIFHEGMPWYGLLIGAVIAFFAHTLNVLLCVMGVLVHGIRLNTLEFSNHKGITWSGTAYRPFAHRKTAA